MISRERFKHIWDTIFADTIGVKTLLAGLILVESILFFVLNSVKYHYLGASYLSHTFLLMIPALVLFFITSRYIRKECPRLAFFFESLWAIFAISIVIEIYCTAIQLTPFHLYDRFFMNLDRDLGFYLSPLVNFTYTHHAVYKFFSFFYDALAYEMLLVPVTLAILFERRRLDVFFKMILISAFLGFTIYYLWPTTDPASVVHNKYLTAQMHGVLTTFNLVHHDLPVKNNLGGGLIGFPSFHVIWSITLAYAFRNRKVIFYPLAIFNAIIISSTLMLGWHFLMDVFGGIAVATITIILAEMLSREPVRHPDTVCLRSVAHWAVRKIRIRLPALRGKLLPQARSSNI